MFDPYTSGVLRPDVHKRLVADIRGISRDAGVQPKWLCAPLADHVPPAVAEWVRRFRFHDQEGRSGLCLTTKSPVGVDAVMSAITGALLRNFIQGRIFTVNQILDAASEGGVPCPTCLLIPNFFVGKALGGHLSEWNVAMLFNLFLERHMSGQQTVVYVSDPKALAVEYGAAFAQHIKAHYATVAI